MIKNDKQYQVTKKRVTEFEAAFQEIMDRVDMDPYQKEFELIGLESQLAKFKAEIEEYESLKSGDIAFLEVESIDKIPEAFVKARIACGLTQSQLAGRIHVKEQQIQRYESNNYDGASIARIQEVMMALELDTCSIRLGLCNKEYSFSTGIDQNALLKANQKIKNKQSLLEI